MFAVILRSLKLLSSRQKGFVSVLAFATLALNTLDIAAIALLGGIATVALGGQINWSFLPFQLEDLNILILYLLALSAALFTTKTIAGLLLSRRKEYFLSRLESAFSNKISLYIFNSPLETLKSYSKAQLEWSILRSTRIAFGYVIGQTLQLFAEATLGILIIVLFLFVDWVSGIVVLLYFVGILVGFQILSRSKTGRTGSDFASGSVGVGQAITDTVVAFKEISVLARTEFFVNRIALARDQVAQAGAVQAYMQAVPRLLVELGLIIGAIGFVIFQFWRTNGDPDLGLLSIFIVGSLRIMSSVLPIQRSFMSLRFVAPQAAGAQDLVEKAVKFSSAEYQTVSPDKENTEVLDGLLGLAVQVNAVSFHYTDGSHGEQALVNVSLSITPGSTVALIGPSGAGKTSLVDIVLGLHLPSSGTVRCGGMGPREIISLRPGVIGYVPQKPGLIAGSLRDNIALGIAPEEINLPALESAIDASELGELVRKLPNGVETDLGLHSDSLSGGQMQRIGLARALYGRPSLLVLDEATSALDAETEASISESLKKLGQATTTIIIAHRLSTVQNVDAVFVMDQGEIIARGTFKDLAKSSPLVKRYVKLMSFDK